MEVKRVINTVESQADDEVFVFGLSLQWLQYSGLL